MSTPVLSEQWMKSYSELWNNTPATRNGLSALSMVIEYRLADDESRVGQIEVLNGEVVRAGLPASGVKPDYVLTASANTWRRLGLGELGVSAALVSRKVKFRGPMSVAMAHMTSLEAAMRIFGQIDETDWDV